MATWKKIDDTQVAADRSLNAGILYRQTENVVAGWQQRGRMSSVCFDFRDPVDIGTVSERVYMIPIVPVLPGTASLKIRINYKVTDSAGVSVQPVLIGVSDIETARPASASTLTSTSAAWSSAWTVDLDAWIRRRDPEATSLALGFAILSQATTNTASFTVLNAIDEDYIETFADPHTLGTPNFSDRSCLLVEFVEATSKAVVATTDRYQTVWCESSASATDSLDRLWLWPPIDDVLPLDPGGTANTFVVGDNLIDQIDVTEYARIQIYGISIEQVMSTAVPVLGAGRRPVIEDADRFKLAVQSRYRTRAPVLRELYRAREQFAEVHTPIFGMGPGPGNTTVADPTTRASQQGSWPGLISYGWEDGDSTTISLFGARIGGDIQFRGTDDTATRQRRSIRIEVALAFRSPNIRDGYALHNMRLQARLYGTGGVLGSPAYTSAAQQFQASILRRGMDGGLFGHTTAFPFVVDKNAAGSTNRQRRTNLDGCFETPRQAMQAFKGAEFGGPINRVQFDVAEPGGSDPVSCMVDLLVGGHFAVEQDQIIKFRVYVLGWAIYATPSAELDTMDPP